MFNRLLFLLLMPLACHAANSLIVTPKEFQVRSKYDYSFSLHYVVNSVEKTFEAIAFVDGKVLLCHCGSDPIMITIMYGHVEGFCWYHLPEINMYCESDCKCGVKNEQPINV